MPKASRRLELRNGLPWVGVLAQSKSRRFRWFPFVLDTGTSHTVLHARTARALGFTDADRLGQATFDSVTEPEPGDTIRLPSLISFGREVKGYLVGVAELQSRIDVYGILGLDFFRETDLLLAFRRSEVVLEW